MVYCGRHDECFLVRSRGVISPTSQTHGLFCLHVGGRVGGGVLTVVSLFATVVTVIGQRIPVIFELKMMAAYSELIRFYSNITLSNSVHCVHFSDQFCLSIQFVSSS